MTRSLRTSLEEHSCLPVCTTGGYVVFTKRSVASKAALPRLSGEDSTYALKTKRRQGIAAYEYKLERCNGLGLGCKVLGNAGGQAKLAIAFGRGSDGYLALGAMSRFGRGTISRSERCWPRCAKQR